MEMKGRVIMRGPVEQRTRKDGSGTYRICHVEVQIGTYTRWAVTHDGQSYQVTEKDVITRDYLHEEADQIANTIHQGDVVMVNFHHYYNDRYGRTETRIDSLTPVASQLAPAAQQQPAYNHQAGYGNAPAWNGAAPAAPASIPDPNDPPF